MANILAKMLDFVGWEAVDEEEECYEEDYLEDLHQPEFDETAPTHERKSDNNKVVRFASSKNLSVIIVQPQNVNEAKEICDHLRTNKPIIVNLENIERDVAQRIVDFVSGSVYSIDGSIQKVAAGIFLATPSNIDIMGNFKDEIKNKGVFPWTK